MATVGVVDGVALLDWGLTVPAVEETTFAVARLVAVAVVEERVAVDALRYRRAVAIQVDVVTAF